MRNFVALVLFALLLGCSAPSQPLRVGLLEWPPYEITRLAQHLGYFGDLELELVEFQSPAEAARAYSVGGIDIVALTLDYTLSLSARDPNHRAFLIINESLGGDAVISREPLPDLAALAGKRIGMESSELGAHMVSRLLAHAGLAHEDVEIVFLDIPDQRRAWDAGEVDVMITYEPVRTQLIDAGGHQVFSSADIPGEIIDVFIARESGILRRQDQYRRFAEGWFRALRHWQDNPSSTAELLAPRLRITPQQFAAAISGVRLITLSENREILSSDDSAFIDAVGRFAQSMALPGSDRLSDQIALLFTEQALPPPAESLP